MTADSLMENNYVPSNGMDLQREYEQFGVGREEIKD